MKLEVSWRGVALFFITTTIVFGLASLFLITKNETPSNTSVLEQYLKSENDLLAKQQDSLRAVIKSQSKVISEKDSLLGVLTKRKNQVKIVYYEKYKKIDNYSVRQLANEFDSIFTKNGVN